MVVVGAGVGGLVAALLLASAGCTVTVVERAEVAGGKLREVMVGGHGIDSGPTVLTMRWVFDAILGSLGTSLDEHLVLHRAAILARHSWPDGSTFDLHADEDAAAAAVAAFAGAKEAAGYRAFRRRTAEAFASLDGSFLEHPSPSPFGLAMSAGVGGLAALARIEPFTSLAGIVAQYFEDPRLRQLFGRYATYCGSSPYEAPGPLMLIAHVEQRGVWLVEGGLTRLAGLLVRLAEARGVVFRYACEVSQIEVREGRATGVRLRSGEGIEADAVVFNGDPAALASGLLGAPARKAVKPFSPRDRSLSALTWSIRGTASGFALSHHTVFFSSDYRAEFDDLFKRGRLPRDPTIYVCAQDRDAKDGPRPDGDESLFLLVNAPARADTTPFNEEEIASCERRVMERLAEAGLTISASSQARVVTGPMEFSAMFPGSGGALYGRSSHGWASSFQRPGARTAIPALYLAGGGAHPGAGLPMAALSGRHAALAVLSASASTGRSRPMAMPGGISTRSAPTDGTR